MRGECEYTDAVNASSMYLYGFLITIISTIMFLLWIGRHQFAIVIAIELQHQFVDDTPSYITLLLIAVNLAKLSCIVAKQQPINWSIMI